MTKIRRSHILKAQKRCVFPERVIYVDCETKPVEMENNTIQQAFWFGFATYRDYTNHTLPDEILFYNIVDFWNWVFSKTQQKRRLYIIAHNTDFDFRVLEGFTQLCSMGFRLVNIIADGGKWIGEHRYDPSTFADEDLRIPNEPKKKGASITVLDSMNWFKTSIKKLGETLGIPKLPFPSYDEPKEVWEPYCMRDVEILQKTIENFIGFIRDNDLGNFAPTLAKQAINAYKHRFMDHTILIHTDERIIGIERDAYYGGRTEAFYIGYCNSRAYYKLDVNSQYPYVMRTFPYPTKLIGLRYVWEPDRLQGTREGETFIADCTITTEVPCIPYRMNHRLCFPTGTFRVSLCEPEYRLALQYASKVEVNKVVFYESNMIFRKWVDEMYALRKRFQSEGNLQYALCTKILMNSLYGKFGQHTEDWQHQEYTTPSENWYREIQDFDTGEWVTLKAVGGSIFEKMGYVEGFDTQVAIAAFVCSYARRYLFQLMMEAGLENVYYTDTDSLIVNSTGLERLRDFLSDSELGKLKIEAQDDELLIHNVKDYAFAGEIKIKGVRANARQEGENIFHVEQWEHLSGAIHRGRPETVTIRQTRKVLKRQYEKGVVSESGRVIPFVVYEPEGRSEKNT